MLAAVRRLHVRRAAVRTNATDQPSKSSLPPADLQQSAACRLIPIHSIPTNSELFLCCSLFSTTKSPDKDFPPTSSIRSFLSL